MLPLGLWMAMGCRVGCLLRTGASMVPKLAVLPVSAMAMCGVLMLGAGGPIGLTSAVVSASKQVVVIGDEFTKGLQLPLLVIGFPPGQLLVLVGAGVMLPVVPGGRRLEPGRRGSMMRLQPPIRLRTVAVSSWPGFLKRQVELVWDRFCPRPCDQQ